MHCSDYSDICGKLDYKFEELILEFLRGILPFFCEEDTPKKIYDFFFFFKFQEQRLVFIILFIFCTKSITKIKLNHNIYLNKSCR